MGRGRSRVLLALAILFSVTPVVAQRQLNHPPTSPLWWTLTDHITPTQLRRAHRDAGGHEERYLVAVQKGWALPVAAEKLQTLVFYINGRVTPELIPLWSAFGFYAHQLLGDSANGEAELRSYGVSVSGTEVIQEEVEIYILDGEQMIRDTMDATWELKQVLREAHGKLGIRGAQEAYEAEDFERLAAATGRDRARVRWLLKTAWDPWAQVAPERLQALKERLSENDWDRFRDYLLREIAVTITSIEFDEEETGP